MAMTEQTEVFISAARLAAEAEQDGARLSSTPAGFALSVAGLNPHEGDFHPMDLGRTAEENDTNGFGE